MIINRENLDALFTGFQTSFNEGVGMAELKPGAFAMVVPSTTKIESYPFLQLLSTIREWIGPRQIQNLEGNLIQIVNKPYEHTIGIPRDDIKDGLLALCPVLFQQMGIDAENLWGKLPTLALLANGTWVDGKAFFVADRKFGTNTICNLTTDALTPASYAAARLMMMSYLGHANQPLGIIPDTLRVGPALHATAKKIIENPTVVVAYAADTDDATELNHVAEANENYQTATIELDPMLVGTAANYWYLAKTKGAAKPVIVQKREIGALIAYDQDHDANVKDHNRNDYGITRRGAAGLAMPAWCFAGLHS